MRPLFGARHQKGRRTGVILGNASNGMRVAILGRLMLHAIASEAFLARNVMDLRQITSEKGHAFAIKTCCKRSCMQRLATHSKSGPNGSD